MCVVFSTFISMAFLAFHVLSYLRLTISCIRCLNLWPINRSRCRGRIPGSNGTLYRTIGYLLVFFIPYLFCIRIRNLWPMNRSRCRGRIPGSNSTLYRPIVYHLILFVPFICCWRFTIIPVIVIPMFYYTLLGRPILAVGPPT